MACNRCMNEYIKQARLTAHNPTRAPSVVVFAQGATARDAGGAPGY